jgi:hypothetical protein
MNPRSVSDQPGNRPDVHPSPANGSKTFWKLLLVIPYIALCFPGLYARTSPALLGFPFFYWYQFLWVVLTSVLLGIIYFQLKDPQND